MKAAVTSALGIEAPTRDEVQGWVVNGYNLASVTHVIATVVERRPVLDFLLASASGSTEVPTIQSARWWTDAPDSVLNVGVTYSGLAALGVPETTLAGFATDFRQGARRRAGRAGDFGESDPENWDDGIGDTDRTHVIFTVHGASAAAVHACIERIQNTLGPAIEVIQQYKGSKLPGNVVHFGYVDGISQPRIEGFEKKYPIPDQQPVAPLGAFFAGHACEFEEVIYDVATPYAFTANASYNAFRVLEQDVFGFEDFLAEQADATGTSAEWLAAKICGRWRNGNPLTLAPDEAGPQLPRSEWNDYDYDDPDGSSCPIGSHMRRANPRNTPIVQRGSASTRRIIRRGMPYGPLIEPGQARDETPRGLLGNFICASLTAQFEGIQQDWIQLGLQHPTITGTNDPMIGWNDPLTSEFRIPRPNAEPVVVRGFGAFVRTRASVYAMVPSLPGLRWLGSLR